MAFKKKNSFKPLNFSGVITNIEKITDENGQPFSGKYNNNIQKMSSYYKYKVSIDGEDGKTFNHNLPVGQDFPFEEGQRVSFKAFPQKAENEYNIVHKSLAKQMSPEEIAAIQKSMESKEEKAPAKASRPRMR